MGPVLSEQPWTTEGVAPVDLLTDAQLACLRLVHRGPSKTIARELGISHYTVDDHIREAMRRLSVSSRHDAAAIVAEWDRAHPQGLGTPTASVANDVESAMIGVSSANAGAPKPVRHGSVKEDRAIFSNRGLRSEGLARLTQYWLGSLFDELTGPNRLRGVITLALIISVIVLALVGIGNAIQISLQAFLPN